MHANLPPTDALAWRRLPPAQRLRLTNLAGELLQAQQLAQNVSVTPSIPASPTLPEEMRAAVNENVSAYQDFREMVTAIAPTARAESALHVAIYEVLGITPQPSLLISKMHQSLSIHAQRQNAALIILDLRRLESAHIQNPESDEGKQYQTIRAIESAAIHAASERRQGRSI